MSRSYSVKEIFYSLQGEGINAGRPAVFCRFAGCNLWSGREADRDSAVCRFCDTDFVGTDGTAGGKYPDAASLAKVLLESWPAAADGRRFVVFTGGEPSLQLDEELVRACHERGFEVAIETNGTLPVAPAIDWVCVSPKAGAPLAVRSGDELKLVFPQPGLPPEAVGGLEFAHYLLQPMDGPERERNTRLALAYCLDHPQWRLSLQTHKALGIR
jgi:7-carboxy-7-deazaguanine synthase